MIDHPTHILSTYDDDRKKVVFCALCSAEGDFLAVPCPGKFIPNRERVVDTAKEHK